MAKKKSSWDEVRRHVVHSHVKTKHHVELPDRMEVEELLDHHRRAHQRADCDHQHKNGILKSLDQLVSDLAKARKPLPGQQQLPHFNQIPSDPRGDRQREQDNAQYGVNSSPTIAKRGFEGTVPIPASHESRLAQQGRALGAGTMRMEDVRGSSLPGHLKARMAREILRQRAIRRAQERNAQLPASQRTPQRGFGAPIASPRARPNSSVDSELTALRTEEATRGPLVPRPRPTLGSATVSYQNTGDMRGVRSEGTPARQSLAELVQAEGERRRGTMPATPTSAAPMPATPRRSGTSRRKSGGPITWKKYDTLDDLIADSPELHDKMQRSLSFAQTLRKALGVPA
jgi:hypothetical protein